MALYKTLVKQGIVYLISSFTFDPLLFLTIVSAAVLVLALHNWKGLPFLLGMALYLGYVVRVGGDFMAGRFLTPAFLMAVILLFHTIPSSAKLFYVAIFVAVVGLGFLVANSRWYVINPSIQYSMASNPSGVVDEHGYYASATGLLNFERTEIFPNSPSTQKALLARQNQDKVVDTNAIGYFGYEVGPQIHVLDDMALGDPLLARLPLSQVELSVWRIGHFHREVPPGYLETLQTGINVIQDPGLAQYYAALHDVVSGPLFSGQRLLEIWNFQTGAYNGLLRHYIQTLPAPPGTPQPAPSPTSDALGIWLERRMIHF